MIQNILAALRAKFIALQIWALVIYLALDACGQGLGILGPKANSGSFLRRDASPTRMDLANKARIDQAAKRLAEILALQEADRRRRRVRAPSD